MIYIKCHIAGSKWIVYINTFINENITVKYVLLLYSFVFILPLFIYLCINLFKGKEIKTKTLAQHHTADKVTSQVIQKIKITKLHSFTWTLMCSPK